LGFLALEEQSNRSEPSQSTMFSRISAVLLLVKSAGANPYSAQLCALEAEHQSLLSPTAGDVSNWQPPVLDADSHLFSWRVLVTSAMGGCHGILEPESSATVARNVTQVSAVLTLTTDGSPPIVCRRTGSDLSLMCGSATEWSPHAARYTAKLDVVLSSFTASSAIPMITNATSTGWFVRGLQRSHDGWGGAEWVGLADANDVAAQYRSVADIHTMGFQQADDVAQATLFVAGLGGYRTTLNDRPLDPTAVRGSVTEWHNRTFYFGDSVVTDVRRAASTDGLVVIGVEVYKHWYGLQNGFYPVAYGQRSLKAVLVLTHTNGTSVFVSPTCTAATDGCSWRHSSGATLHEDLHTGQTADGRLAKVNWESVKYDALGTEWAIPTAVKAPAGALCPHPMPRSRVLEIVRPIAVRAVAGNNSSGPGSTYRFTLPYEVAGFCTTVLPRGSAAGTRLTLRHGEAVDTATDKLVAVECVKQLGQGHAGCENTSYVCRGDATGMSAHERSWRRLAIGGNTSGADDPDREAFTPAFQFSAFRFIEASYDSSTPLPPPDVTSIACYRVGVGFDWIGDVAVAPALHEGVAEHAENMTTDMTRDMSTTAAERFNAVVAATRSTAISNYLMDIPTDCPHREKRGWTGDSLAAHRALASFFDMRATWTKWVDDMLFTQSNLSPMGAMSNTVPCIFTHDFFCQTGRDLFTDVAWGSALPLLAAYTANLTDDVRFASRAAVGAGAYVELLHRYTNNASSEYPHLLNYSQDASTGWPGTGLGDWVPAKGGGAMSVSSLLNSHHLILDTDAAVSLLRLSNRSANNDTSAAAGGVTAAGVTAAGVTAAGVTVGPSQVQLEQWAAQARESFSKAYLQNVTIPDPAHAQISTCGSAPESQSIELRCGVGDTIKRVVFAGYGIPNGTCANGFRPGDKCYLNVSNAVALACVGQSSCSVECSLSPGKRVCAGVDVHDPCNGIAKHLSVSVRCSGTPTPSPSGITGLAFRDSYPPVTAAASHRTNNPPAAQTEAAAGLAAMDVVLTDEKERAAMGSMMAAMVTNVSSNQTATVTGGIIDTAHLAPALISFGHPNVAFDFLAADGQPSYYNMAKYGGTLWENWKNADACDTAVGCTFVGSLNHIMYGGSVGEAVFGIAGIQPFSSTGGRPSLAPIPWLPDAPRGAAVWRSRAGVTSTAWAATSVESGRWHVWVNVTVPAGGGGADVQVMLPQSAQPDAVCVWECGLAESMSVSSFASKWVSFDASGGHWQYHAVLPSATAPPPNIGVCAPVWHSGAASKATVVGIEDVQWAPARLGHTMFPAIALATTSGSYTFFAQSC
jgi:hypothetical protein